ncbi:hypothetical protein SAMN05443144_103251 [Fodinibius roseus]|uniref:Lipoprotein n=1 Tax=Fodinibius roseus TaxID=1194090 RepID=A0A1M4WLH7_9BACT|nr:hypothetical protein [Fodinibius roseus]SHE82119.1 hypothetical protein SAMN05443144_103251 [Fodinibius roseus]
MKLEKNSLFILLMAVFLSGCGIQMPVSEGLVFSNSDPYGQQHEEILPFIRYSGAVTAVSTMPVYSSLQDAAIEDHGSGESHHLNQKLMTSGGNPGFGASLGDGRRFAVAFTPGIFLVGMHADATVRTVENVFITVNQQLGLQSGTELILQRPVWERKGGGISVGAFFRSQPMQFVEEDERWSRGEPEFHIQWYGLRLIGQSPDISGNKFHLRGFINAGYAGEYQVPLVGLGMAFAFD